MVRDNAPSAGLHEDKELPHTAPIELYHNAMSLCSQKVRVCLAEKGIDYKSNHIHLIKTGWHENCTSFYKKINPAITVPVLVHNGHPVYESTSQVQYLDAIKPDPELTPKGLEDEVTKWVNLAEIELDGGTIGSMTEDEMNAAASRSLGNCMAMLSPPVFTSFCQDKDVTWTNIFHGFLVYPSFLKAFISFLMKFLGPSFVIRPPFGGTTRRIIDIGRKHARQHLEELDKALRKDGRPYVTGADFTLADVAMLSLFERCWQGDYEFLFEDLLAVKAYWQRLQSRPSFKEAILNYRLPIMQRTRERVISLKKNMPAYRVALEGDHAREKSD